MNIITYLTIILGVPSYLCILAVLRPKHPMSWKCLLLCILFPPFAWGRQTFSLIENRFSPRKAMGLATLISLFIYLEFTALSEIIRNSQLARFQHSQILLWFLVPIGHIIYFALRTKRPD